MKTSNLEQGVSGHSGSFGYFGGNGVVAIFCFSGAKDMLLVSADAAVDVGVNIRICGDAENSRVRMVKPFVRQSGLPPPPPPPLPLTYGAMPPNKGIETLWLIPPLSDVLDATFNRRIFGFIGGAGMRMPPAAVDPTTLDLLKQISLSVVEFNRFIPEICMLLIPPVRLALPPPIGVDAAVLHPPREVSFIFNPDSFLLVDEQVRL